MIGIYDINVAYAWHVRGIFVYGTDSEVHVAVGCIFVDMGKYIRSGCSFSIIGVWLIIAMWQPIFVIM